jgi:hypothetical protein
VGLQRPLDIVNQRDDILGLVLGWDNNGQRKHGLAPWMRGL